ncbi:FAD-dependent oxidoreductase (plasmid) [Burkholderia gladioli pv. gladioli]|uniref:Squalene epoxidase family protein n=1 Tax=Burkholderia gladioli TaxID=28095 RepID=A0AAW3ER60_BURGA|nr:FAD-dependent oxidoreductase [Burkholderia gladioli]AJW93792.1 squalene epoxidase family protein [Burkholderia gladioli]KGC09345.1 squalene epoxidase family protein [Burkholderia gladioli]MDJ1167739.1 FAD-dependent oxidoreductase [Burkholderia gladioli pv. gladioli]QPQ88957.1 FAD-dependent oxidoreductase [Burkholderia gladioli]SPU96174.1 monooxygenase FAD-binding protein [Burkholderia gladioli]
MSAIKKVLIVGGGIAGLSAAIALKQRNIEAVIVEKNPQWSVYGVGIIQPSNMLRALRSLGLGDKCLRVGRGFNGWRFCNANGDVLAEAAAHNIAGPGYPAVNGITRPALHTILTEAVLAQGTDVRLGVTIERVAETGDSVNVEFTDGQSEVFDLVIGADGAYSKMRSMLFGVSSQPTYTGQGVWRYNFPRPKDLDWGCMYFGKKTKVGLVPLSESGMYMFLLSAEPGNPRMPADKLSLLLRDRMDEYGGLIAELRELVTDSDAVVYRPMEAVMLPGPWHQGRVVLLGDAAHSGTPHLAEGAAMAIEDSIVLAEMVDGASDIEATLQAFWRRRAPRAQLVYETGIKLGEWEQAEWRGEASPGAAYNEAFSNAYSILSEPI